MAKRELDVIEPDSNKDVPVILVNTILDIVPDDAWKFVVLIDALASNVPVVNPVLKLSVEADIFVKLELVADNVPVEILVVANNVPVVILPVKFKLVADALVKKRFDTVALVEANAAVEILVVARMVPVVIPDDALRVPLTSNVWVGETIPIPTFPPVV